MVVLVDEKEHSHPNRRFRQAPPIPSDIRGNSLATSLHPRTNTRLSDYSDENAYPSRGGSPLGNGRANGYSNGNGVARVSAMDDLRGPASPRRAQSPLTYDQRGMRSGASSVKGQINGQASVDSFRI
jgi:hypothetical protein